MPEKRPRNPEFQRLFAWLGLVLGAIVTVFLAITLLFSKNPPVGILLTVFFAGVTVVCGIGVARLRRK